VRTESITILQTVLQQRYNSVQHKLRST